nr:MAG TPA: hypothetical protein [Caudoviricetes sp.]
MFILLCLYYQLFYFLIFFLRFANSSLTVIFNLKIWKVDLSIFTLFLAADLLMVRGCSSTIFLL